MAYSFTVLSADGATSVFAFSFGYLSREHIKVTVNGDAAPFTWLDTYTVRLQDTPSRTSLVRIERNTPLDSVPVDWTDGSVLAEEELDYSELFSLYTTQEAFDAGAAGLSRDKYGVWDAKGSRITNVGDSVAGPDAVNQRTMWSYVEKAVASVSGGLGNYIQGALGSVFRTFQQKLRGGPVSPEDFGAIGDRKYHPLSERFATVGAAREQYPHVTSLAQSIDWAAIQSALNTGKRVIAESQHYVITDDLVGTFSGSFEGLNTAEWNTTYAPAGQWLRTDSVGVHLYYYGIGPKKYTKEGVSDCSVSGGVRTIAGLKHDLLDFYNKDAVGGAPATLKRYSVGFKLAPFFKLSGVRLIPWFRNGCDGYNDASTTDLGDSWDVGVDGTAAWCAKVENVQVVGDWRMAGVLLSDSATKGQWGNAERIHLCNVMATGMRGLAVRGWDRIKVLSYTTTSVTVPYDPSFHWNSSGSIIVSGTGVSAPFAYAGTTFDAGTNTVTFYGLAPALAESAVPFELRGGVSNGFAFTTIENCYFMGLEHANGLRSDQMGLGVSKPIEVSGFPVRGIKWINTKFQTHESSVGQWHDVTDPELVSCQSEGRNASVTYLLASPFDSGSNPTVPNQRGQTENMRCDMLVSPSVNTTYFTPRGGFNNRGMFPGNNASDDHLRVKNWRRGQTILTGDAGAEFLVLPASDDAQQDPELKGLSYRIRAIATDFILQALGGKNFRFDNAAGTTILKLFGASMNAQFGGAVVPATNIVQNLGSSTMLWLNGFIRQLRPGDGTVIWTSGTGSPEGVVTATVGSLYTRKDGATGSTLYVKETGIGNTGWTAK